METWAKAIISRTEGTCCGAGGSTTNPSNQLSIQLAQAERYWTTAPTPPGTATHTEFTFSDFISTFHLFTIDIHLKLKLNNQKSLHVQFYNDKHYYEVDKGGREWERDLVTSRGDVGRLGRLPPYPVRKKGDWILPSKSLLSCVPALSALMGHRIALGLNCAARNKSVGN